MPDAGSTERIDGSRKRGTPRPPRFINRLPNRLPPPLKQLRAGARSPRASSTHKGGRDPWLASVRSPRRPLDIETPRRAASGVHEGHSLNSEKGPAAPLAPSLQYEKGPRMRNPSITSLDTVTLEEALSYIDSANGDELGAAGTLAQDRNRLDGSISEPDETEVHHALFLLRRARGLDAPSFDLMRVQLRRRVAA